MRIRNIDFSVANFPPHSSWMDPDPQSWYSELIHPTPGFLNTVKIVNLLYDIAKKKLNLEY